MSYLNLFKTPFGERVRFLSPDYFWYLSNISETRHFFIATTEKNNRPKRYQRESYENLGEFRKKQYNKKSRKANYNQGEPNITMEKQGVPFITIENHGGP